MRSLVETGALAGELGAYRLTDKFDTVEMPATVHAIIASRIDRLGPEQKRLLQSAAVIGHDIPYAVLRAVADLPDGELNRGLADLQAAEFIYETRLFPDLEYTFKHAFTHEVAYGGLLERRRRELHLRASAAARRASASWPVSAKMIVSCAWPYKMSGSRSIAERAMVMASSVRPIIQ